MGKQINQKLLQSNLAKLPDVCYGVLNTTNEIILLKKGETGYWPTDYPAAKTYSAAEEWADELNGGLDVTRAQRKAMEHGSMCGFDLPIANPDDRINQR